MDRGRQDSDAMGWQARAPGWFWLAAAATVVANGLGAVDYTLIALRFGPWLGLMPPAMAAFLGALPVWVRGAWALGVWSAVAGSALMLARVRHAAVAYALSFAGAVASLTWVYGHGAQVLGRGFLVLALAVMAGVFAQLWFSRAMFWRGVLR